MTGASLTRGCASHSADGTLFPQESGRFDLGNPAEVVEAFVRAFNRMFAGASAADLAAAVEKGVSEALQVSLPILSGHCEVAKRDAT